MKKLWKIGGVLLVVAVLLPGCKSKVNSPQVVEISNQGVKILGGYSIGDSIDEAYETAQKLDPEVFSSYLPNPDWFELSFQTDANPFTEIGQLELALEHRQLFTVKTEGYYVVGDSNKSRNIGTIEVLTAAFLLDGFDRFEIEARLTKEKGMNADEVQHHDVIATFAKEEYGIPFELVREGGINRYYYRMGDVMMTAGKGTFGSMTEYSIYIDGDYGEILREKIRSQATRDIEDAKVTAKRLKVQRERQFKSDMYGRDRGPGSLQSLGEYKARAQKHETKMAEIMKGGSELTIRKKESYEYNRKQAERYRGKIAEAQKIAIAFPIETERIKKQYDSDIQKIDPDAAVKIALIRSSLEEKMADLESRLNAPGHGPIVPPE